MNVLRILFCNKVYTPITGIVGGLVIGFEILFKIDNKLSEENNKKYYLYLNKRPVTSLSLAGLSMGIGAITGPILVPFYIPYKLYQENFSK